jgi:5-formyltetrahydrofolate cyclo-ligase
MDDDTQLWTKFQLRRSIRERMKAVGGSQLQEWSWGVAQTLQAQTQIWHSPGIVALFGGLRDEPDLISYLLPWLRERGWRTVLFAIQETELLPYEVTCSADLERGPLGAWEPVRRRGHEVAAQDLTVVLVPGMAFAAAGGIRLGRGGGYFDRLLARPEVTARRVGVAFEMQVLEEVPREPHDACVQALATEVCWREFEAGQGAQ